MSAQEQAPSSSFDTIKWILALVALAAAVYANHYFGSIPDGSVLVRAGVIITLVAVGLGIGFTTTKGKEGLVFAKESRIEARKVVWPNRQETIQTTLIIIVSVTIVSLLLWGLDALIVTLINLVTLQG